MRTHALASCSLVALLASLATAASAETELRFGLFTPKTHWYHVDLLEPWAAEVARVTDGRVTVEFTAAPLGPMPRNMDMVADGIADVAAGVYATMPGRFRVAQITELPAEAPLPAVSVAYWRVFDEYLRDAGEHEGVHVLSVHASAPLHLFSTTDPVDTPEALANMKLITPSATVGEVIEAVGGVPLQMPVTERYDAISKGVVDGGFMSATSVPGWRITEYVTHGTRLGDEGFLPGAFFLVANADRWAEISEADQAAIMEVSGEAYARRAGEGFAREQDIAFETIAEAGIEMTEASDAMLATLSDASSFITEQWRSAAEEAGIDADAAIAFFRDQAEAGGS